MALARKTASATIPVNMGDTLSALNNAAAAAPETSMDRRSDYTAAESVQNMENRHPVVAESDKPLVNSTNKTMISLRLLKKDKEKFQNFFREHGLSFTDGLYMAADFIEKEVQKGRLQMSKSGIQYN